MFTVFSNCMPTLTTSQRVSVRCTEVREYFILLHLVFTVFTKSILTADKRLRAEYRYINVRKCFILDEIATYHDLHHGG